MNKEKSMIKIGNENYIIKGTTYKCENGETTIRIKVYSEKNPKIWMLFEPNKENPEKLDLIKKSKNK